MFTLDSIAHYPIKAALELSPYEAHHQPSNKQ